jgi:uncharacterized protein
VEPEKVVIHSDVELAGHLRVPPAEGPAPAVVLTGPLSGVKEQVVGRYADELAERGLVTLAFDHRGFGASDGRPRQHEDAGGKLADLRDATSLLASHEAVAPGQIACVGVCLGGGYALRHAAADPRIAAVVAVAGCFNDPRRFRESMGVEGYRRTLTGFADLATAEYAGGRLEEMPAVSPGDGPAAMPGREPWEYYGTERSRAPGWENRITRRSIHTLLTFDAAGAAELLPPTPMLLVHGRRDDYCSPQGAEDVARRHGGDVEVIWLDAEEHIDLYDVDRFVTAAVEHVATWLSRRMSPTPDRSA